MATPNDTEVEDVVAAAENDLSDDFENESFEDEAPQPVAAKPTATAPDPLDAEVPVDQLPGYWKQKVAEGKRVRYRDIMNAAETAEEKIRKQGQEANTYRDRANVLEAQVQAMREMIAARSHTPAPPPKPPGFGDFGIADPNDEILREGGAERVGTAAAHLGARIASEQLDPRISQLEAELASLKNQGAIGEVRSAAEFARTELGVDPQRWEKVGRYLWAAASSDARTPRNKDAWKDAWNGLIEAFPQPEPRSTIPREGIVRGNPSGSSRSTPVRQSGPGKQRVRGLVSAMSADAAKFGFSAEDLAELEQRTEANLRAREGRDNG